MPHSLCDNTGEQSNCQEAHANVQPHDYLAWLSQIDDAFPRTQRLQQYGIGWSAGCTQGGRSLEDRSADCPGWRRDRDGRGADSCPHCATGRSGALPGAPKAGMHSTFKRYLARNLPAKPLQNAPDWDAVSLSFRGDTSDLLDDLRAK